MPEITAENGFAELYERHYRMVYRICFTYMKNKSEAEDCTEDVFVKVLSGNFIFHDETHEKKWLTVTAINLCKDRLKHWFRRMVSPIEDAEDKEGAEIPEPDETLDAVMKLPPKYKDVIYLHYYMDYKTDEIAEMLHKPPSTVRNHLSEARALLKKQIGGISE